MKSSVVNNEVKTHLYKSIRGLIDEINLIIDNCSDEQLECYGNAIDSLDKLYMELYPKDISPTVGLLIDDNGNGYIR